MPEGVYRLRVAVGKPILIVRYTWKTTNMFTKPSVLLAERERNRQFIRETPNSTRSFLKPFDVMFAVVIPT